jgi:hypothetical protein
LRWISFRNYLTKDEVAERFGDDAASNLTYQQQNVAGDDDTEDEADTADIMDKAEIWEIWDKDESKVCWVSIGYNKVLEAIPDPLQLSGFFPVPPFLLANSTTSLYIPTPDYVLSELIGVQMGIGLDRLVIRTGVKDRSTYVNRFSGSVLPTK